MENENIPEKSARSLEKSYGISLEVAICIVIILILLYVVFKNRGMLSSGKYLNAESWNVEYNDDGLPTKIEIHRDASRS